MNYNVVFWLLYFLTLINKILLVLHKTINKIFIYQNIYYGTIFKIYFFLSNMI